jgi:nitrate reductase assembly molybdenum cofactor insertion protein NarJ
LELDKSYHEYKEALVAFADVFDYPSEETSKRAWECASLLTDERASSLMKSFYSYVKGHPLGHVAEVYTRTFDLQPSCSPYIGYHIFGDGYRRGEFLARLKGRCSACGLDIGRELPDHISVVLRLLPLVGGSEEDDLVALCLSPALDRMSESLADEKNPYSWALQALSCTIRAPQKAYLMKREVS